MIFFQIILLLVILPLSYGPIGHYLLLRHGGPDLFVLTIWGFVWLTDRRTAVRWAFFLGLSLDLLSFLPFGLWTLFLVCLTYLIDYLKLRFFEISSIAEALLALFITNLLFILFATLLTHNFQWSTVLIGIITNLVIGLVMYYFLAIRYRLVERWKGRQL